MEATGWTQLIRSGAHAREATSSIAAYSEFMPPPRFGCTSSGRVVDNPLDEADPSGWYVSEHEEADELQPGLEQVAHQVLDVLARLVRGVPAHGLSRSKLEDNLYWPLELERAARAGALAFERLVVLMPLALARTQDDKGRVRWTFVRRQRAGSGTTVLAVLLEVSRPGAAGRRGA